MERRLFLKGVLLAFSPPRIYNNSQTEGANFYMCRESTPRFTPTSISIPGLEIGDQQISQAEVELIKDEKGQIVPKWNTPDHGLVSNGIAVWGHSRMHGIPQLFGRLKGVNYGDQAVLKSEVLDRFVTFVTNGVFLADQDFVGRIINNEPNENSHQLEMFLITSLREKGSTDWLMNIQELRAKNPEIVGDIDKVSNYAYLVIRLAEFIPQQVCQGFLGNS